MIKKLLTLLILSLCLSVYSQNKPNAIIKNDAYVAYVDTTIKMPIYVQYKLYKGGGNCERSNKWINDSKYKMIGEDSYAGSGYEKGHLANAEDFAYNCHLDSLTFNNYNRLPQTKALNRGIWKKQETAIRKISQKDSLLIICGGYWESNSSNVKGMLIPSRCWKVVYSLTAKQVLSCSIFTNTENPSEIPMTVDNLEIYLGYSLNLPKPSKKKKKK
jgi:endonuclease G